MLAAITASNKKHFPAKPGTSEESIEAKSIQKLKHLVGKVRSNLIHKSKRGRKGTPNTTSGT